MTQHTPTPGWISGSVDARPNGQHRRFASHGVAAESGFERARKMVGRQKVGRSRGCGSCAFDGRVDAALVDAVEMGEAVELDAGIDDVGVAEQFAGGEFDDERADEVVERVRVVADDVERAGRFEVQEQLVAVACADGDEGGQCCWRVVAGAQAGPGRR